MNSIYFFVNVKVVVSQKALLNYKISITLFKYTDCAALLQHLWRHFNESIIAQLYRRFTMYSLTLLLLISTNYAKSVVITKVLFWSVSYNVFSIRIASLLL